ncbi:MAG: hypothetical protein ACQER6_08680 [Pseudomonadota bacterium]
MNEVTQRLRLHAARIRGQDAERDVPPEEALRLAKLRLTLSGSVLDDVIDVGRQVVTTGVSNHPWASLATAFAAGGLAGRAGGIVLLARGIRLATGLRRPARRTKVSACLCRRDRP